MGRARVIKVSIILIIFILSLFEVIPLPFVFAILPVVLIDLLLIRKEKLSNPFKGLTVKVMLRIILYALLVQAFNLLLITQVIERFTQHRLDVSSFEQYRTSIAGIIGLIVIAWIIGGFLEELIYRKYVLKCFLNLSSSKGRYHIILSVTAVSVMFASVHLYQSVPGTIDAFIASLFFSFIYLANEQKLGAAILAHGFYNTFGIIALLVLF